MTDANSVTCLFDGLREREDRVIQQLWDRYFARLVKLAGARMPRDRRRMFDEEDVALSAFQSFCDRAARDSSPNWLTVTICGDCSPLSPRANCTTIFGINPVKNEAAASRLSRCSTRATSAKS